MIKDGKGRGYMSGVNSENRLETHSVIQTEARHISSDDEQTNATSRFV